MMGRCRGGRGGMEGERGRERGEIGRDRGERGRERGEKEKGEGRGRKERREEGGGEKRERKEEKAEERGGKTPPAPPISIPLQYQTFTSYTDIIFLIIYIYHFDQKFFFLYNPFPELIFFLVII